MSTSIVRIFTKLADLFRKIEKMPEVPRVEDVYYSVVASRGPNTSKSGKIRFIPYWDDEKILDYLVIYVEKDGSVLPDRPQPEAPPAPECRFVKVSGDRLTRRVATEIRSAKWPGDVEPRDEVDIRFWFVYLPAEIVTKPNVEVTAVS